MERKVVLCLSHQQTDIAQFRSSPWHKCSCREPRVSRKEIKLYGEKAPSGTRSKFDFPARYRINLPRFEIRKLLRRYLLIITTKYQRQFSLHRSVRGSGFAASVVCGFVIIGPSIRAASGANNNQNNFLFSIVKEKGVILVGRFRLV